MFDYNKIFFHEKDDSDIPVQYFFEYRLNQNELAEFIAYYVPDMPDDKELDTFEICVSQYSQNDWKVEFVAHLNDGTTEWLELLPAVRECDEFMERVK